MRVSGERVAQLFDLGGDAANRPASFEAEITVPRGSIRKLKKLAEREDVEIVSRRTSKGKNETHAIEASGSLDDLMAFLEAATEPKGTARLDTIEWDVAGEPERTAKATVTKPVVEQRLVSFWDRDPVSDDTWGDWRSSRGSEVGGIGRQTIVRRSEEVSAPMLTMKDVASIEGAAKALAKTLKAPAIEAALLAVAPTLGEDERARFQANAGAFALLADAATSIGDEVKSLAAYRTRNMRGNPHRNDASRDTLRDELTAALKSASPSNALEGALIANFLREVGLTAAETRNWAPTAAGVRNALEHETLMPMRVLREGLKPGGYDKYAPRVMTAIRSAIDAAIEHAVKGDFREWVYENPLGRAQLAMLNDAQRETWKSGASVTQLTSSGTTLSTKEVDDIEGFWVTKINSQSHAFDSFARQCLVPLLANARTKAIVVDDPDYPLAPTARAYLRVFNTNRGPVLYLDPVMNEYRGDSHAIETAIARHAAEKAAAMGLPLALTWGRARGLFRDSKEVPLEIDLKASNAGIEASDTIDGATGYHDWDNTSDQRAYSRSVILVDPKSIVANPR